ncbi:MAG: phosphate acyltransferase PlsX [Magnetococcales bacterium]|nr:phosphate acyltransferase PlsX [Magnetococcales bacterium]
MTIRIALDAMGGDNAPASVVDGAIKACKRNPDVKFILVGLEDKIRKELELLSYDGKQISIQGASQVVEMGEPPALALRKKKDSSMRVGCNMVKSKEVDAFVSAGNSGALMAIARFVLKMLPGIDRPAMASNIPSITGQTLMLDLGANVDCDADNLCQFAIMGEVYATAVEELSNPRIGLLNIGSEDVKGNEVVKEAGERLKKIEGNKFIGNVEATDIFLGNVDVVVCDGFVGNVSLKTTEGVAKMLTYFLKESFSKSWLSKLRYLIARPTLREFRDRFDPRAYNGAMLLGLNGVVVKSHGGADGFAFAHATQMAVDLVVGQVNDKIQRNLA